MIVYLKYPTTFLIGPIISWEAPYGFLQGVGSYQIYCSGTLIQEGTFNHDLWGTITATLTSPDVAIYLSLPLVGTTLIYPTTLGIIR